MFEETNLVHSWASSIVDAPVPNLAVIVTGTYEIILVGMEINWRNHRRMSDEITKGVTFLQK